MWLACHTQEEIAAAVDLPRKTVDDRIKDLADLETFPKSPKLLATFQDADFW
jgi:predicted DNA-binding transcriptional regulator AlpA